MDTQFGSGANQGRRSRIVRKLTARWKPILLLWLVLSAASVVVIDRLVEPTYVAASSLRIKPRPADLFDPAREDFVDLRIIDPFVRAQAAAITDDRVLGEALKMPPETSLPSITRSQRPLHDLRKNLAVEVASNSCLIRVSLKSRNPREAAAIVDGVVQSYMAKHAEIKHSTDAKLRSSLLAQLEKLKRAVARKGSELKALSPEGIGDEINRAPIHVLAFLTNNEVFAPYPLEFGENGAGQRIDGLAGIEVDIARLDREIMALQDLHDDLEAAKRAGTAPDGPRSQQALDRSMPVFEASGANHEQYNEWLHKLRRSIEISLMTPKDRQPAVKLLSSQINTLWKQVEQINTNLARLSAEDDQEPYRVVPVEPAAVRQLPSRNERRLYLATAPVGILMLMLGLFLVLPGKNESTDRSSPDHPIEAGELESWEQWIDPS